MIPAPHLSQLQALCHHLQCRTLSTTISYPEHFWLLISQLVFHFSVLFLTHHNLTSVSKEFTSPTSSVTSTCPVWTSGLHQIAVCRGNMKICPQAGIVYRKMSAQCAELSFRLSNFPACSPPVCKRVILNKKLMISLGQFSTPPRVNWEPLQMHRPSI